MTLIWQVFSTGVLGCAASVYSPRCVVLRIVLLIFNIGLSVFDCYSDWRVWKTVSDEGFNHPLLEVPTAWVKAWLTFTVLGTVTALLTVLNELSGAFFFLRQCNSNRDIEELDLCRPCSVMGFNYVTRTEFLALINLCVEDFPLLILTLLFDGISYTCSHPMLTQSDSSAIPRTVLISSLASALDVGWCLVRILFRIVVRIFRDQNRVMDLSTSDPEAENRIYANEFYPKEYKLYLSVCVVPHAITTVVCNGLAFIVSLFAVVIAGLILSNHNIILADSKHELGVYRNQPDMHLLTNVSAITTNGTESICLKEEFALPDQNQTIVCTLALHHDLDDKEVYFNFAENLKSERVRNLDANVSECKVFYEDIFLGWNTTEGKVKRFDETCWGARIISDNTATLERNEDLATNC